MVTIPREAFHASLRSTFRVVGNPAANKRFLPSWARASTSSTEEETRPHNVTKQEAETAFHLAVTLVHLFRSEAIRLK